MNSIKRFNNGHFLLAPLKTYPVTAAAVLHNEDWKTASAHNQRPIQPGEKGTLLEIVNNFYGSYAYVKFDDVDFNIYVDFEKLELVGEI